MESDSASPTAAHLSPADDAPVPGRTVDPVGHRRAMLSAAGIPLDDAVVPPGAMGVAFSGGGIRSATISLGVAQALAESDRLLDFDFCSTVSGGGYFGSFLGGLFLPDWARGPKARPAPRKGVAATQALREKHDFAIAALTSKARDKNIAHGAASASTLIRNPVWWLREHSRYLAPDGMSDYLAAAIYMARNWLAMIYGMVLPLALIALFLVIPVDV